MKALNDGAPVPGWVLGAVLAGLLARVGVAAICDVSLDEAFTYFLSTLPLPRLIQSLKIEAHPPGIYLLTKLISGWTHSPFLLRLPSVIAGSLTAWLAYLLGRRLGLEEEARWVCLIVALNWLSVLEEAQIRMYGPLNLCCLSAILLFLNREKSTSKSVAFMLGAAVFCLPWLHLFGFGLVGLMGLLTLKRGWATNWQRAVVWSSAAAGGAWLLVVLQARKLAPAVDTVGSQTEVKAANLLSFPTGVLGLDAFVVQASWAGPVWYQLSLLLGAAFWVACGVGAVRLTRQEPRTGLLLAGFALVPAVVLAIYSIFAGGRFTQHRYFAVFLPVLLLLCFKSAGPRFARAAGLVVAAANLVVLLLMPFNPGLHKQYWREVVEYLERHSGPEDKIVVYDPYAIGPLAFYYPHGLARFQALSDTQGVFTIPEEYAQVIPVFPGDLSPEFRRSLGDGQVFLLLNQEKSPAVREWFRQRYGVLDAYEHQALNWMGSVSLYRLAPLPEQTPPGNREP